MCAVWVMERYPLLKLLGLGELLQQDVAQEGIEE
jgi:hypothetical protein